MADPHDPHAPATPQEKHEDSHTGIFRSYMMVFAALCVFTAASFAVNRVLGQNLTSAGIIFAVAIVKACLVGYIFMHLKYDWPKVYGFLIPIIILCVMSTLIFLPDFGVYYWNPAPWNESP